jgi:hypothetical protein
MATDVATSSTATIPQRHYSPLAGFLSYLVPGLGQIYQGRIGKGLLFLVCLYGMFFYGMSLGQWSNVYVPRPPEANAAGRFGGVTRWLTSIGQFWIGVAAWPALYHYNYDARKGPPPEWVFWRDFQREPPESADDVRKAFTQIEDLEARKKKLGLSNEEQVQLNKLQVRFAGWEGRSLNELQANGDKSWDLGLIFTLIAGVLNLLVIYDAFAGPAQLREETKPA